jgi:hypothetical protein
MQQTRMSHLLQSQTCACLGCCADFALVLTWIAYDARPDWRHTSKPSRCCCKCPPYVCEALSDFVWAGIWLALLMTMVLTNDHEPRYRAAAIMGGVLSLISGCLVVRLKGVVAAAQAAHAAVYAQVMGQAAISKGAAGSRRQPRPQDHRPQRVSRQQAGLPARAGGTLSPRGSLDLAQSGKGARSPRGSLEVTRSGKGAPSGRGSLEVTHSGRGELATAVHGPVSRQAAYMEPPSQPMA